MAGALDNQASFWLAKAAIAKTFASKKPPVDTGTRDSLCQIVSNLYLSSCHLEAQKDVLHRKGVTHVLQVGKELSPTHPAAFTYKHVPVYDLEEEDLVKYFPECFAFINSGRETGAVLVHCAAGVSRSASVVIGYLMATGGLSLDDARAAVKASRPAINPNQGFLLQLQLFQEAGCSVEGWQQWNLERFLRVRSAAYSRGGPQASLAAAPADRAGSLMRGACEVSPPVLNQEDSISPVSSPKHLTAPSAAGDGEGGLGYGIFAPAARSTVAAASAAGSASNAAPAAVADRTGPLPAVAPPAAALPAISVSAGGHDGAQRATVGDSFQVRGGSAGSGDSGGAGGTAAGWQGAVARTAVDSSYSLPTPGSVAAVAEAAPAAAATSRNWASIVAAGASGGLRIGLGFRLWQPYGRPGPLSSSFVVAAAAATTGAAAASAPAAGSVESTHLVVTRSRSLQRQLSADDAVSPIVLPTRTSGLSLPSIGPVNADTISLTASPGISFNHTGNTANAADSTDSAFPSTTSRPAAIGYAAAPLRPGPSPDPPLTRAASVRARTTSGIADAGSLAAWAAAMRAQAQEQQVWPWPRARTSLPELSQAGLHPGQQLAPVAAEPGEGCFAWQGSSAPPSASRLCAWPEGQQQQEVSPDANSVRGSSSEGLHLLGDPGGISAVSPDPRALWSSEMLLTALPQLPPPPQQQQQPRPSQPSFEAGPPLSLSPIPSDDGCSEDKCQSETDDDVSDSSGGGAGSGYRNGGSTPQLKLEHEPSRGGSGQRRSGSRHGFLRRSLSDRLQGILGRVFAPRADAAAESGGGDVSGMTGVPLSQSLKEETTVGNEMGQAIGGKLAHRAQEGSGLGGEQGQQQQQLMTGLYGSEDDVAAFTAASLAVTVVARPATALRLSTDSGTSSSAVAAAWPDGNGTDGSTNSSTTMSQESGTSGSGGAAEERSDATSGGRRGAAGRTDGSDIRVAGAAAAPGGSTYEGWARQTPLRSGDALTNGAWALVHSHPWAQMPVLTPAGLERTPSKVPQVTPDVAGAPGGDRDGNSCATAVGPAVPEGATDELAFAVGLPGALAAPRSGGDLAATTGSGYDNIQGTISAARSAALSHLLAAQALSHGSLGGGGGGEVAALTAVACPAHVRSDAEITALRTPSLGSTAVSPRGPFPGAGSDALRQESAAGPHPHSSFTDGSGAPALAQHVPGRNAGPGAKASSRLATATFADAASDGVSQDDPDAASRYGSSGAGSSRDGATADAAGITHDKDGHGEDTSTAHSLQRYSAPVVSATGLQTSAAGMVAEATLPPVGTAGSPSPPPATLLPVRPLRLSIPNIHGSSRGGVTPAAVSDIVRPDGGGGTPIHKRVLRSLTSFLGRSLDSPTAAAAADPVCRWEGQLVAGLDGPPTCTAGASPVPQGSNADVGAAQRQKLWAGLWPEAAAAAAAPPPSPGVSDAGSAGGPAAQPPAADRHVFDVAGLPGSLGDAAAAAASATASAAQAAHDFTGNAVRAGVLLPPAASLLPADSTRSPASTADTAMALPLPPAWTGVALQAHGITAGANGAAGNGGGDGDYGVTEAGAAGRQAPSSSSKSVTSARPLAPDTALVSADGSGAGVEAGVGSAWRQRQPAEALRVAAAAEAAAEEEEVIEVDLLPDAPFRWTLPGADADEWQQSGAVEPQAALTAVAVILGEVADGTTGLAGATSVPAGDELVGDVAVESTDTAVGGGGSWRPSGGGTRRFSLDGRRQDDVADVDGPSHRWQRTSASAAAAGSTVALGPSSRAAATPVSYLTSLAAMADAALLPAPVLALQLGAAPPTASAAAEITPAALTNATAAAATASSAEPAMIIASAPLSAAIGPWWRSSSTAINGGGGNTEDGGMQRAVSIGVSQGLPIITVPPAPDTRDRAPEGHAVAVYGSVATAHGSGTAVTATRAAAAAAVAPAYPEPAGACNDSTPSSTLGTGAWANAADGTTTATRRARSSCSGALSTVMSPRSHHHHHHHVVDALAGGSGDRATGPQGLAAAADAAAPSALVLHQWQPPPQIPGTDAQQQQQHLSPHLPRLAAPPLLRGSLGSLDYASLSLPLPHFMHPFAVATALPPPSQQQQQLRSEGGDHLHHNSCASGSGSGSTGDGRVMPSWAGSRSSASLLTVPSDPEAPSGLESSPMGRLQQGHHVSELQQQQHLLQPGLNGPGPRTGQGISQSARATVRSSSTGSSAAAHAAAAAAGSLTTDSSLARAWDPMRAAARHYLGPGQLQPPPPSSQLQLQTQPPPGPVPPRVAAWEALPAPTAPLSQPPPPAPLPPLAAASAASAGSAISLSVPTVKAMRLSLSPTPSSGGSSSSSTQSPRAAPAVVDIPELDPLDFDALDALSASNSALRPVLTAPAPLGRGRPDPSLLKPVLGRKLLPMPSPSRIMGSPAGTPRGSAGGASAAVFMSAASAASATTPSHLAPRRPLLQGPVDAFAHQEGTALPSLPHVASARPQGLEPQRLNHVTDLRVLPQESGHDCDTAGTRADVTAAHGSAGERPGGGERGSSGRSAPPPPPLSVGSSAAGGGREEPAGFWPGQDVRSPSTVCGSSKSNSDDGERSDWPA